MSELSDGEIERLTGYVDSMLRTLGNMDDKELEDIGLYFPTRKSMHIACIVMCMSSIVSRCENILLVYDEYCSFSKLNIST